MGLEVAERLAVLRELPAVELAVAMGHQPDDCEAVIGWDREADAPVRCDRPGRIRLCGQGVCCGCCDASEFKARAGSCLARPPRFP